MADELQARIDSLKSKAKLLTERYKMIVQQKQLQNDRIEQLEATVDKQQREIRLLQQQNEQLRIVSTMAVEREDMEHTRTILTQLVRDIDKCIAELTD